MPVVKLDTDDAVELLEFLRTGAATCVGHH